MKHLMYILWLLAFFACSSKEPRILDKSYQVFDFESKTPYIRDSTTGALYGRLRFRSKHYGFDSVRLELLPLKIKTIPDKYGRYYFPNLNPGYYAIRKSMPRISDVQIDSVFIKKDSIAMMANMEINAEVDFFYQEIWRGYYLSKKTDVRIVGSIGGYVNFNKSVNTKVTFGVNIYKPKDYYIYDVTSDTNNFFMFDALIPGTYRILISTMDFKQTNIYNIIVKTDSCALIDVVIPPIQYIHYDDRYRYLNLNWETKYTSIPNKQNEKE